jgi:hypothetical protein
LPDDWVSRVFLRLEGRYGSLFLDRWKGCDLANVKATWAEELAGFADKPECIGYALQSLADQQFPPTLPEFLAACRRAPVAVKQPALPFKADSEKAVAATRRLMQHLQGNGQEVDSLHWARCPKSQIALDYVIDGAKKSGALAEVLADLKAAGVCSDNGKLLKRYKGQGRWEAL